MKLIILGNLAILVVLAVGGCGLISPTATPTPSPAGMPLAEKTPLPAPMPECRQSGTTTKDEVLFPESGEMHGFMVYLPPCYAENIDSAYPVLYWTSAGGSFIFDTVDQLIRQGDIPPYST